MMFQMRQAPILEIGKRSRPLLLPERTMFREGQTPFSSLFTIQISGKLEEGQIVCALASIQNKHPLLRCVVQGRSFVLLKRPQPIPLRIVERHSDDDWQREVRREWCRPFHAAQDPLLRVVWLRASFAHELLLVAHHCICDGQSGITLLRDLLAACDDPAHVATGSYDALGAIEDLVPQELLHNPRFHREVRRKRRILRLVMFFRSLQPGRKPAPRVSAEQMYFHRWLLDEASTKRLTERAKAEGVTVLSAAGLALMQAFRDVRGAEGLRKTYAMVNARRYLPRLRSDALFGIVPGIELSVKGLSSTEQISIDHYWSRARRLKNEIDRAVTRLGRQVYSYLVALEGLHDQYGQFVFDTDNAPAVRHLTISNLGKIELQQQYQGFRLEAVYSPLVMVSPTPANTVVLSTFAGRMEFAIISDEFSLPHAHALAIQRRSMEILNTCVLLPGKKESSLAGNSVAEQTT
ncbi:MAG: condensation domain-containing protein [Bacillota bacterium]|nr:condensation domain-containing protein [Bacillota bacterium]